MNTTQNIISCFWMNISRMSDSQWLKLQAVSYASLSTVQFNLPFVETDLEREKQSYDKDTHIWTRQ